MMMDVATIEGLPRCKSGYQFGFQEAGRCELKENHPGWHATQIGRARVSWDAGNSAEMLCVPALEYAALQTVAEMARRELILDERTDPTFVEYDEWCAAVKDLRDAIDDLDRIQP